MKKLPAFRTNIITLLALVCIITGCLITGCQDNPSQPEEPKKTDTTAITIAPVITAFTPESARADAIITIAGKGFGADKALLAVRFGNVDGSIVDINDTLLHVIVPRNAQSAPITVTRGGKTATSAKSFRSILTYRATLNIDGITGVFLESLVIQTTHKELDTIEQPLMFGSIMDSCKVYHGPGGIDTIRFVAYESSYRTQSWRNMTIILDTIAHRIISGEWNTGSSGTDEGSPGHYDDKSFNDSQKFLLRNVPYTVTGGVVTARIDAGMLSKDMIDYESRGGSSSITMKTERSDSLIGLGQSRPDGAITVTIEMR